jgi:hypothetical protein
VDGSPFPFLLDKTRKKEKKEKKERQSGGGVSHTLCGLCQFYIKKDILLRQKKNHGKLKYYFTMQKLYT